MFYFAMEVRLDPQVNIIRTSYVIRGPDCDYGLFRCDEWVLYISILGNSNGKLTKN